MIKVKTGIEEMIKRGNTNEIKEYIKNRDINEFDDMGLSLLHYATIFSDEHIINLLLELGADINSRAEYNDTPIQYACANEKIDNVKCLISKGASIEDMDLIKNACLTENIDLINVLIKAGCDINEKDIEQRTPIFWAVQIGSLKVVKILYENHANFEIRGEKGDTILSYAVGEGKIDIVKFLLSIGMNKYINDPTYTPIILASYLNRLDIVKLLIQEGANINQKDELGNTALIKAIKCSNWGIVEFLMDNGADTEIVDTEGRSAVNLLEESYTIIGKLLKKIRLK